jgi:aminoglycoside 6'-N-acetyltransferase I
MTEITIRRLKEQEEIPYKLLLLADPSKKQIDKYIFSSDIYIAEKEKNVIACYVLKSIDNKSIEIKNIAVDNPNQGKGIGMLLINHACETAKKNGFINIIIGTGNSSTGQLYLYHKAGFSIVNTIKDFFIDNYDEPIFENGIQCKDMIVLSKTL